MSDYQADNDYDELIDNLPASLRNKILTHLDTKASKLTDGSDQDLNVPDRHKRKKLPLWRRVISCIFAVIWFLWAIPWIAVGIVACITIIGIPLGVLLMKIGVWPLQRQITYHLNRK